MIEELIYRKVNGRWEVVDKEGNKATGATKIAAENQYRALYKMGVVPVNIDYTKFNLFGR